jgi:hypothetical protein
VNVVIFVYGRDCVRATCPGVDGMMISVSQDYVPVLSGPSRFRGDVMEVIAKFVTVQLLDQLLCGLCDRHRCSSCRSLRHAAIAVVEVVYENA